MRTSTRSLLHASLAAALVVAVPAAASAQVQANGNGRALDANPQVGSGGGNGQIGPQPLDFRQRNDIITGNVGGLGGFRDDVGYRAPGEFQGDLGSDDLFRFNRQSLPSSPFQGGAGNGSPNLGGVPSVYRDYSNPLAAVGTLTPGNIAALNSGNRIAPSGGFYNQYNNLANAGTGAPPGLDASGAVLSQTNALNYLTSQGELAPAVASPLLGIRSGLPQTGLGQVDQGVGLAVQPQLPAGVDALGRPIGPVPTLRQPDDLETGPNGEAPADPRLQTRLNTEPFRPLLTEDYRRDVLGIDNLGRPIGPEGSEPTDPLAQQPMGTDARGRMAPGLILGQQIQGRLGSERGERLDPMVEQRLQRMGQNLVNRGAVTQGQPGGQSTAYGDLMGNLSGDPTRQQQRPGQTGQPGQPGGSPKLPGTGNELEAVDEAAIVKAEIDRLRALDRVYGGQAAADAEAMDPLKAAEGAGSLEQLLQRLNYDLPPLQTLAGDEPGRISELMREAENALAQGQYFDAEATYRQVLNLREEDPMPRVGLVHSQMGAGMIRSAALNLRQLFEAHPEVIAARYAANLMPQEDRLQWLRGELQRAIGAGEGGAESGLMMAYLGYQVGSQQLIRYGLATAEAAAPRDPLLPVVRAIWLDGQGGDADGETVPPAAAE